MQNNGFNGLIYNAKQWEGEIDNKRQKCNLKKLEQMT